KEKRGMGVDHRYRQPERADPKDIAQEHDGELQQHKQQAEPDHRSADYGNQQIDGLGHRRELVVHRCSRRSHAALMRPPDSLWSVRRMCGAISGLATLWGIMLDFAPGAANPNRI